MNGKETLRVLDLFSGIGGFSLGLKRAGGFRTVAYCEIEPYCQEVLKARMLDGSLDTAPICTDVTRLDGRYWQGHVELIAGGFPCQDISRAGKREGIDGERSGLWREIARLVREIRPRFVFVENVSALLAGGVGVVLGDLAENGYDAEWCCIPASALGAPHHRDRFWMVAYPRSQHESHRGIFSEDGGNFNDGWANSKKWGIHRHQPTVGTSAVSGIHNNWTEGDTKSILPRLVTWFPRGMDRIRASGNAVVPQVVEWIGRRIQESLKR